METPERISREELYEDIKESARFTRVYLTMAVLSTFVVAIGLHANSVTLIIRAMVIASRLTENLPDGRSPISPAFRASPFP